MAGAGAGVGLGGPDCVGADADGCVIVAVALAIPSVASAGELRSSRKVIGPDARGSDSNWIGTISLVAPDANVTVPELAT